MWVIPYMSNYWENVCREKLLTTSMRQETERCELCFREAEAGNQVALICSGDAGIYGLASLMYELGAKHPETELLVIPGITAASSGAAVLGAPLNHDFCVISLSDLMTPWEKIEKRLRAAAVGDFAMAIYNPSSHRRKDYLQRACDILLETIEGKRPVDMWKYWKRRYPGGDLYAAGIKGPGSQYVHHCIYW